MKFDHHLNNFLKASKNISNKKDQLIISDLMIQASLNMQKQ
jgi:hypothetical protein